MFKREKKSNSGLATKRVKDLLDEHINMLTRKNRTFQVVRDEGYYLEQMINPNNPDDYVKIGYTMQKKLLTRSFSLELRTAIGSIYLPENFKVKLSFSGFPKVEKVYFKGKKESEKYARYFNDRGLLRKLKKTVEAIDVDYIIIEYSKSMDALIVRVSPIPGGVIWIVFPPVFYKMPLKQGEIDALWKLLITIRNYAEEISEGEGWR